MIGIGAGVVVLAGIGARVFYKKNMDSEAADHSIKFAIGKYHNDDTYDKGWRRATAAQWGDPAFQAKLVQAHREGGGWPLLEEPLVCDNVLYVAEGPVRIDGAYVIEVGHNWSKSQKLRGVYPAMNMTTQVAWTTTAPALGNTWTVAQASTYDNVPCLFVRDESIVAVGNYKIEYEGYRRATEKDWTNDKIQAAVVNAQIKNNGLLLLKSPLPNVVIPRNRPLSVSEGYAMIDNKHIVDCNWYSNTWNKTFFDLTNKNKEYYYCAMISDRDPTNKKQISENGMLGKQWSVKSFGSIQPNNLPCLFIKNDLVSTTDGGKKTRRRKHSRKLKRGTKKH